MFAKGTQFYPLVSFKCPYCHEGDFFVDNNPYNLSIVGDVRDNCSVCLRNLTPEPGFYIGAMYASYALAIMVCAIAYIGAIVLFPEAAIWTRVATILITLVFMAPLVYTLSKLVWAIIFMKYVGIGPTEKELTNARGPQLEN